MICILKIRKTDRHSKTMPEKLVFRKQDGSEIHMTWDSAELLRSVDSYEDYNLLGARMISTGTRKLFRQGISVSRLMDSLKDVGLAGENTDFVQVNIVNEEGQFYLMKGDAGKIRNKWAKGGDIRFSLRYRISVGTDPGGKYRSVLYDRYRRNPDGILTESYDGIPEILKLRHESKTFLLLAR